MLIKLAWRNITGAGVRSIINIGLIALVLMGMIWMQALYGGWLHISETQSSEWDTGGGRYQVKSFDRYDPFTWDNANARIPDNLLRLIDNQRAVPILVASGSIYPQGRLMPLMLKGIPAQQQILRIPTTALADSGDYIPAVIGRMMAKSASLKQGDTVTLRWRDNLGAFDAQDILIKQVMDSPVPDVDVGQIWIDLDKLQEMKALSGYATLVTISPDTPPLLVQDSTWQFQSSELLLKNLRDIVKSKQGYQYLMFMLMLFLVMLAIFDTQALAVFRRRKEIGTFSALGMTQAQIIRMFTLEGIMYSVIAVAVAFVVGLPVFIYFGTTGLPMPKGYADMGYAGLHDNIVFQYPLNMIITTVIIVLLLLALVSWLPTLRIARMKPTDALRGRM